jgi:hypothetical protein
MSADAPVAAAVQIATDIVVAPAFTMACWARL